jgi:hypothetical protein
MKIIGRVENKDRNNALVRLPKHKGRQGLLVKCKKSHNVGLNNGFRVVIDTSKIIRNSKIPFVWPNAYTPLDQTSSWQYGFLLGEKDRQGNFLAIPGRGGNPVVLMNSRSDLCFQETPERVKFTYDSRGRNFSFSNNYQPAIPTSRDDSRLELMLYCTLAQKVDKECETLILYDKKHIPNSNNKSLILISKSYKNIRNTIDTIANQSVDPIEINSTFSSGVFVAQYDLSVAENFSKPDFLGIADINFLLANEVYKKNNERLLKICGKSASTYITK